MEKASEYPVKIIQIAAGSVLSPAAGLYTGYRHAAGQYIFFVNGDMTVDRSWFTEAFQVMNTEQGIAGLGGDMTEYLDPDRKDTLFKRREGDGPVPYIGGAALYRKEVLDDVGPFNPFLYGEEEAELGYRITAAGHKLLRIPVPMAHHWGTYSTKGQSMKRSVRYIRGYGQTLRKALGTPLFRQHRKRLPRELLAAQLAMLTDLLFLAGILLFCRFPYLLYGLVIAVLVSLTLSIWKKRSLRVGTISFFGWFLKGYSIVLGFLIGLRDPEDYPMDILVLKE